MVNTGIGVAQELRAKRALDRLAILTAGRTRAVRDGTVTEIPLDRIVLDDVLELGRVDQVPVDGTVLEPTASSWPRRCSPGKQSPSPSARRHRPVRQRRGGRRLPDPRRPRRRRSLRRPAPGSGPAVQPDPVRAPAGHQPDPAPGHLGDGPGRAAADRKRVPPQPRHPARRGPRLGGRGGGHGPGGPGAAHLPGVRGGRAAAGPAPGAGAGTGGDRGPGPGRRAVHRQDRHADRAGLAPASHRGGHRPGGRAGRRGHRRAGRRRRGTERDGPPALGTLSRPRRVDDPAAGAVLLGPQVERGDVRRPRHLPARRPVRPGGAWLSGDVAAAVREHEGAGRRVLLLASTAQTWTATSRPQERSRPC